MLFTNILCVTKWSAYLMHLKSLEFPYLHDVEEVVFSSTLPAAVDTSVRLGSLSRPREQSVWAGTPVVGSVGCAVGCSAQADCLAAHSIAGERRGPLEHNSRQRVDLSWAAPKRVTKNKRAQMRTTNWQKYYKNLSIQLQSAYAYCFT